MPKTKRKTAGPKAGQITLRLEAKDCIHLKKVARVMNLGGGHPCRLIVQESIKAGKA